LTRPVISRPKPVKGDRPKKPKPSKSKRKILEVQLEALSKLIVHWRDGAMCVERHIDGTRCGGGIQWGHYIPRNESAWLKFDLGNTYSQCRDHNGLHKHGSQTMGVWFVKEFGQHVADAMQAERSAHRNQDRKTWELEEMLARFEQLYQDRFYAPLDDLQAMIAAGYYGEVVKDAVFKDGVVYKHEGHLVTTKIDLGEKW
jgi:hypothetical protein